MVTHSVPVVHCGVFGLQPTRRDAPWHVSTSAASPQLQAIDSLMWTRPDSALARIMPWLDTCLRDVACNVSKNNGDSGADVARYVSTTFNRHYAQLLLAELLYKNDYPQTNREELLKAVDYFDSLVREAPPLQRGAGGLKNPHVIS